MHRYHRITTVRLALALVLLVETGSAYALGLGKFVLRSGLDEPLNAEIEVTAASPQELKSLKAGLASRDEFDNAGIDRPAHLTLIRYTLTQRPDGTALLKLATDEPIREPFLHFLVKAEWAGGRIVREYTALLDPPHLATASTPAVAAPSVEASHDVPAAVTPVPVPVPAPVAEAAAPEVTETASVTAPAPAAAPAPAEDAVAPPAPLNISDMPSASEGHTSEPLLGPAPDVAASTPVDGDKLSQEREGAPESQPPATPAPAANWAKQAEYQVKPGDTLGAIVRNLKADNSLSAEQVMLALLKTNKAAFFGNNVNNLKSGKILKLPAREDVEAISKPKALKEFRAQYNSWQEYKLKLASSSQLVKAPGADKGAARGEIAAQPAEARKDSASKDTLKIVRAENDKLAQKGASGERAALPINERQALMDKAATLEEALTSKELENKELRERVTQLETQIKNAKRLVEIENKELAKTQKQAGEAKEQKGPAAAATPVPPPVVATEAGTATPKPDAATAVKPAQPPAKKPVVTAPPPPPEESLIDTILAAFGDMFVLSIIGGAAVVGGGAFLIYYRRRKRAMAEFGESILSGGLSLNSEGSAAPGPEGEKSADVSFLSDFSQGGMGNIHTDEVDPIAEAEVYLAYGRDEQAEEILKEAVVKDPTRHELRLKLMEIYQQRNDLRAFETVAEELYAALEGRGGRVWEKAEEMGYKMNPQNPLFRGGANRVPAASAQETASPLDTIGGLTMQGMLPAAESSGDNMGFDLDLGEATPAPAAPAEAVPEPAPSNDGFSLDLEFGATQGATAEAIEASVVVAEEVAAPAPSGGIDFDFSALTASPPADDAASTELTLDAAPAEPAGDFEISFESAPPSTEPSGGMDFGALSLEGEGEMAVAEVSGDEIATKLDLAKAYIDMGDADGARSILDEVLAEGSDAQKKQAAALAAQIAA